MFRLLRKLLRKIFKRKSVIANDDEQESPRQSSVAKSQTESLVSGPPMPSRIAISTPTVAERDPDPSISTTSLHRKTQPDAGPLKGL